MLLAAKRTNPDELARFLNVARSTVFDKISGKRRWYASEVQALADYFNVPVAKFYAGAESLIHEMMMLGNAQTQLFDLALAS